MNRLNTDHLFRLTDDTGIFQHAKYSVPDPARGYTTDDNSRALLVAVMLYETYREKRYLDLVYRYLSFVLNARNEKGKFKNFMGYNREFLEAEGSEDCFGRCLWSLGYTLASESVPANIKHTCRCLVEKALPHVNGLYYPRARAYSIIGLSMMEPAGHLSHTLDKLARALVEQYEKVSGEEWRWFEDEITYSNAILPWALLCAFKILGKEEYLTTALESLDFLERITFPRGEYFKPVGSFGWMKRGQKRAEYDEQPLEAAETVFLYLEAYRLTKKARFLHKARQCLDWYEGCNSRRISLLDKETGGCYDGVTLDGVNLNQGSESIISYCMAFLALHKYGDKEKPRRLINSGRREYVVSSQIQTCL